MIFERPWMLVLALLPLAWAAWEWRRADRRLALALKALTLALILAAVAEPVLRTYETKTAVVVLADTSASISPADLKKESDYLNAMQSAKGRNRMVVLPFARSTRAVDPSESVKGWALKNTASEQGRGTGLESAIRDGLAALPEGLVPRVLLLSDGRENMGSAARGAWQAKELGVAVDVVPLAGRPQPEIRLESVSMPPVAFSGERFPVELVINSPKPAQGTLELQAEGKTLGSSTVQLDKGVNRVSLHANVAVAGAVDIGVVLKTGGGSGDLHYDQVVNLRRPKILYITQDPQGTGKNFLDALAAAQFDVTPQSDPEQGKLSDYQLVAFNNWDLESIPTNRKAEIENYVKGGGGLLVIGGERNVYVEGKKVEDALDRTLPAKLAPPRSPEGTAVVLIIDKSSSMEGRKMELARLSAIGVIENLRPIDLVGVLIFDNSFQWAVPIRRAEDKSMIKRLVAGITPDGGTQIAPALTEAYRKIMPTSATYKHIVLLTDGISEEGDSLELSREATNNKVTISTVGLGQDVNKAYLEKVAAFAGGKSYFLNEPNGLEQILLRDVMEHTGSTAVEKPLKPTVLKKTDVLENVAIETAPALKGYVKFKSKPDADEVLGIDKDPLYVRWQYGLGRAGVFTSDAKSRWASDWIKWAGFDKFWMNVLRDLLPHAQSGEATAEYDAVSGELQVDYRLTPGTDPAKIPPIFVIGPDGFHKPIPVAKIAESAYRGRLAVGQRQGLFRIRPVEESPAFPEIGLYRQEDEMSQYGSNEFLLRQVAAFTGGRFAPAAANAFDAGGRAIPATLALWPGLIGLAIALNLAELIMRKWKGLFKRAA
ncbi:MAG TPA: VWA domain-containing protein [Bryobacteraceae bacterium]